MWFSGFPVIAVLLSLTLCSFAQFWWVTQEVLQPPTLNRSVQASYRVAEPQARQWTTTEAAPFITWKWKTNYIIRGEYVIPPVATTPLTTTTTSTTTTTTPKPTTTTTTTTTPKPTTTTTTTTTTPNPTTTTTTTTTTPKPTTTTTTTTTTPAPPCVCPRISHFSCNAPPVKTTPRPGSRKPKKLKSPIKNTFNTVEIPTKFEIQKKLAFQPDPKNPEQLWYHFAGSHAGLKRYAQIVTGEFENDLGDLCIYEKFLPSGKENNTDWTQLVFGHRVDRSCEAHTEGENAVNDCFLSPTSPGGQKAVFRRIKEHVTLFDNDSFAVYIQSWEDGLRDWHVIVPLRRRIATQVADAVMRHIRDELGFTDEDDIFYLNYASCFFNKDIGMNEVIKAE